MATEGTGDHRGDERNTFSRLEFNGDNQNPTAMQLHIGAATLYETQEYGFDGKRMRVGNVLIRGLSDDLEPYQ